METRSFRRVLKERTLFWNNALPCLSLQARKEKIHCLYNPINQRPFYLRGLRAADPFISVGQRRRADFMNYSYGVYLCAHYISRLTCVNLSPQTHCLHNCGKMPQHSDGPRPHVEFRWNHVLPALHSNQMK